MDASVSARSGKSGDELKVVPSPALVATVDEKQAHTERWQVAGEYLSAQKVPGHLQARIMSYEAVPVTAVLSVFAAEESLCGCCGGDGRLVGLFFSLEKAKAEMRCVCDYDVGPRRRVAGAGGQH